ncbi:MarR family winged helix-turn-helix transcriptional regulator [Nakamurella aerolata]|uniref:Winged helix-turn-helix transcriptional regulator n=1 Tax=Nakamurella aerolata TaxID=1656892 RepID=A0A849ADS3_9ACTN|nr:MarR family winged helix-turn-helix transcriptional regulator [Nakamurella aerolata]NNG36610.1 winged helix-turn-helix transcriptional regulator [Nakamurella aerolata]
MSAPEEIGSDLLSVAARLNRWATSLADLQVPFAQARLLSLIDLLGKSRVSDLAAADHCSQPTMTNQLHRLAEAGLVKRSSDPSDARVVLITLTPAGRAALRRARKARSQVIQPYIASLSAADQRRLAQSVTMLNDLMDTLPRVGSVPER